MTTLASLASYRVHVAGLLGAGRLEMYDIGDVVDAIDVTS